MNHQMPPKLTNALALIQLINSFDNVDFMHICAFLILAQFVELVNFFVIFNWLSNIKKDIKDELDDTLLVNNTQKNEENSNLA